MSPHLRPALKPLIDITALEQQLVSHPEQRLTLLKSALKEGHNKLKEFFDQGSSASSVVYGRAQLVDEVLALAYRLLFAKVEQPVALVAVGGYGRGELHPYSDVDIMILLEGAENETTRNAIEQLVTLLWDSKLEVGHSVRTLDECVREAREDITVATNIMESRHLAGDHELFSRMQTETAPEHMWDSRAFFQAKLKEQDARHRKHHGTANQLEPSIKESPGGLRDLQMIGWVAKRHFGAQTLTELVAHRFLTENENQVLVECQELLWRIRCSLHYLTGRREDRLLFDYQQTLAKALGYQDCEHNLAVEQFMQNYYRTVTKLQRLNEMLLQLFQEAILYADNPGEPQVINDRFQTRHGFIEVRHSGVFLEEPSALLEIFLILGEQPQIQGVRAETIRLIRQHRSLIDDEFRHSVHATRLFMSIISYPTGVTHELRRMNRYGILAAYIPAFEKIVGRMQYDLFHAYTVDVHTLFVVRNLRRFATPEFTHEFPLCSSVSCHIPKPELLYLAGLFHDIAKGRGGDHSELGAIDAKEFCLQHALSPKDAELVAWLVKHHLFMSMTAQRKDISDPEVIHNFAQIVENLSRLDHLYLLTVADIRATNPKHWNSWKDRLLSELYNKTAIYLRRGQVKAVTAEESSRVAMQSTLKILERQGYSLKQINPIVENLHEDYFLRYTPQEAAQHINAIVDTQNPSEPRVKAISVGPGTLEIFLYLKNVDSVFATAASTLEQLGLNILDAAIMSTKNGYTLDTFRVLEENKDLASAAYRAEEITEALKSAFSATELTPVEVTRHRPRVHKYFEVKTEVSFEQDPGRTCSIALIAAADRPGLLARIGKAFVAEKIRVHSAKIATLGEKAEDVFHITDMSNRPIVESERQQKLRDAIIAFVEGERS